MDLGRYFNPRSREGSDLTRFFFASPAHNFNPRSREGSDNPCFPPVLLPVQFQSTLPRRERRLLNQKVCLKKSYFNPRSREGSDAPLFLLSNRGKNFNPRSREGSDKKSRSSYLLILISIHAPAKGATEPGKPYAHPTKISIHAPAKGATLMRILTITRSILFQSTLPRRERPDGYNLYNFPFLFQSTLPRRERQ